MINLEKSSQVLNYKCGKEGESLGDFPDWHRLTMGTCVLVSGTVCFQEEKRRSQDLLWRGDGGSCGPFQLPNGISGVFRSSPSSQHCPRPPRMPTHYLPSVSLQLFGIFHEKVSFLHATTWPEYKTNLKTDLQLS